ncbi:serine/threonine-protein kinase BLUS1-like [Solanum dulcamara]|uniref:serine/threonine-protein kinase BLUS1-like n=1 Tax=Solanum dulcamara TaxID=45834 RepID=UPI0024869B97|nr:serine/threonine-protein kinase BLUS1-like [Solanum dulcamara]
MNPRNSQHARKQFNPRRFEIGSSRSLDLNKPSMDFDSSLNQPTLGETITDPHTNDTYLLNLEIGFFSNGRGHVYRALFSKYLEDDDIFVPSGYVTLKIHNMNLHENEFNLIQREGTTAIINSNIIRSKRTFIAANLFCISLPYMSEGSIRCILSTRPNKKVPEDIISIILKEVLIGLNEIHVESNPMVHKTLNAGDIFVNIDDATKQVSIKLAFEVSVYDSEAPNCNHGEASSSSLFLNPKSISEWGAAPEVFEIGNENNRGPKSDIWLVGITAMELAYGNIRVRNRRDLNYIIEMIRENKTLPKSLESVMNKKDSVRYGEFSREFNEMVLACLREKPEKRPTADELLNTPFFSAIERFKQFLLNEDQNK